MLMQNFSTPKGAAPHSNDASASPITGGSNGNALWAIGVRQSVPNNRLIYAAGDPAVRVYQVAEGTVRTFQMLEDGRRQITSFLLPGDSFGYEGGDRHRFSAESIGATQLVVQMRERLEQTALHNPGIMTSLWRMAAMDLSRAQAHFAVLGRRTAMERVCSLLLQLTERLGVEDLIPLPMGRQDIADYLGLTIETVSRTFTALEDSQTIRLPHARQVIIRDIDRLRSMKG